MLKPVGINCEGNAMFDVPTTGTLNPITPAIATITSNPMKKDIRIYSGFL
jgi:hypothetical protein